MLKTKEHYELISIFERTIGSGMRLDKEPKDCWKRGIIYQNGDVNIIFKAFRSGYAFGKNGPLSDI